jgi:hypothetical protein
LVARIEHIAGVFAEVDPRPANEWIEDFRRDQHPENEIAIWEILAGVYSVFTKDRSLSLKMKKDALHLLLLRTMNDKDSALEQALSSSLGRSDAAALLTSYENIASAKSWRFETSK